MKKIFSYLAFIPFVLAIGLAIKVSGEKLFAQNSIQEVSWLEKDATDKDYKIQVALLLDVSSSMNGLIDQAKAKLWQVVNELSEAKLKDQAPNLEIALLIYGGSDLEKKQGYIKQLTGLTQDLDLISEQLFSLNINGGDEYCGQVIHATQTLEWSSKSEDLKMIFIAGNEGFNQGSFPYQKAIKDAASQDIIVNTIFCGSHMDGINTYWKHGADLGNGAYMNIDQNMKAVEIQTPYDDQLGHLNQCINKTYVAYGVSGYEYQSRQIAQDNNALGFSSSNFNDRAIAKCQSNYFNGDWDLVDATKKNASLLDTISVDLVPQDLQGMDRSGWVSYIGQKSAERDSLQKLVLEINSQRKAYIAQNQDAGSEDLSLDQALLKAVREQAQRKNYTFEAPK